MWIRGCFSSFRVIARTRRELDCINEATKCPRIKDFRSWLHHQTQLWIPPPKDGIAATLFNRKITAALVR